MSKKKKKKILISYLRKEPDCLIWKKFEWGQRQKMNINLIKSLKRIKINSLKLKELKGLIFSLPLISKMMKKISWIVLKLNEKKFK